MSSGETEWCAGSPLDGHMPEADSAVCRKCGGFPFDFELARRQPDDEVQKMLDELKALAAGITIVIPPRKSEDEEWAAIERGNVLNVARRVESRRAVDVFLPSIVRSDNPKLPLAVHIYKRSAPRLPSWKCLCCQQPQNRPHVLGCEPHSVCEGRGCDDCYGGRCLDEFEP